VVNPRHRTNRARLSQLKFICFRRAFAPCVAYRPRRRMRQVQAIIFDMDGVIVDSESRHERAFLEVVRDIGYADQFDLCVADYIGRSDQELWVDFVARYRPPQPLGELLARKRERMVEIIRREQPVFDGLPKLVEMLSARYALALASGSERAVVEEVLKLEDLGKFFSAVVSGSDIQRGKPAPDIFLRAAALLNLAPQSCCVVEDSKPGVAAGLAAGMEVIAITNTHPAEELQHATHIVRSYPELERLLMERRGTSG
jgi:HAD superfamily hydrolase (TIGR01509 family)